MSSVCRLQAGVTLIEILTAMAVLSVGIMSVASLALVNMRGTSYGHNQSQATILAEQLADTMRLNLVAYESDQFSVTPVAGNAICTDGTACSYGEQAEYDTNKWVQHAAQALPGGVGIMCMDSTPDDGAPDNTACDGLGTNTIKLFWIDTRNPGGLVEGESFHRHVVSMVP